MLERRSISENVAYGAELARPAVDVTARVAEVLAAIGLEQTGARRSGHGALPAFRRRAQAPAADTAW